MKWFLGFFLLINVFSLQAHQPDLSSTMLVEREDSTWILQVRAAMTAFEYEVKVQFPDSTFASGEKFKELVIKHVRANLSVQFNEQDLAVLENPYVKLGHETNVLFEVKGVPENIKSLSVKNSSFSDIGRNQSGLVVFKEGFTKEQFVLNNANAHRAELKVEGNKFVLKSGNTVLGAVQSSGRSLVLIALASVGFLAFFWFRVRGNAV